MFRKPPQTASRKSHQTHPSACPYGQFQKQQSLPVGWLLRGPFIVLSFWIAQAILLSAVCFQTVGSRSATLWQAPSFAWQPAEREWSKGIDGIQVILKAYPRLESQSQRSD
jgi:hypothetical protein